MSFEIEQLLLDAFNQFNQSTWTVLSQTSWNSNLTNATNIIMILRDIDPVYYSFDLWKIYVLDRLLTNSEHLGFYQNPV